MLKIFDMIQRIAPTPANVLIYGESGTGKELVAQAIHTHSKVAEQSLRADNLQRHPRRTDGERALRPCQGIVHRGHQRQIRASSTRPTTAPPFSTRSANLPRSSRPNCCGSCRNGRLNPSAAPGFKRINVRIIAATNRILEDEIVAGRFREDLFYRLAVVPMRVPPLRERKEDVPLLVDHFLKKYSRRLGKEVQEISSYAMQVLMNYNFPGNVRELENIIERGVALGELEHHPPGEPFPFGGLLARSNDGAEDDNPPTLPGRLQRGGALRSGLGEDHRQPGKTAHSACPAENQQFEDARRPISCSSAFVRFAIKSKNTARRLTGWISDPS